MSDSIDPRSGMPRELPDHQALRPDELSDEDLEALRTARPCEESFALNRLME
jgi:hypothetical protein